ncbi:MAG: DUF3772 domain-containing protein [Novosphingobium sp.]|nr:DUF3772 domain-containing protein [Novosphingobium sp.]
MNRGILADFGRAWQLLCCAIAIVLLVGTDIAFAQPADDGSVEQFDKNAKEARAILSKATVAGEFKDIPKLNAIRERLAKDRDRAKIIADNGSLDSRLLQAQVDALGPVPKEGESESPIISARRDVLNERLAKVMEPVLRWRELQVRAAVLTAEIDQRIHTVEKERLTTRASSPLNPGLWITAFGDFGRAFAIGSKNAGALGLAGRLLIATAAAVALFFIGVFMWRKLRSRFDSRIRSTEAVFGKLGLAFLEDSISAILLMVISGIAVAGLVILIGPVLQEGLAVSVGVALLLSLILLAVAQWLGRSTLLSPIRELRLINLENESAQKGLRLIRDIGAILALVSIVELLEDSAGVSPAAVNLLSIILVIAGCVQLWRLATLIAVAPRAEASDGQASETGTGKSRMDFASPLSRLLKAFAVAAIVASLAGFVLLARDIFSDVLISLAVIALAVYLQRTLKMILSTLARGPLYAYRRIVHLLPMATGLAIVIVAMLLIALVWGYRSQEVGDFVTMLRTGVEFGDISLSVGDIFTFALVFFVGYAATRFIQRFLRVSILPEFNLDHGAQSALVTGLGYVGIMLAAVIAIASTGLDLSSLAFVFGALSVGLGFGLQSVVENFTSGILLLIERPVRVGDWIEVGEHSGIVRKIAVRSTHIETFDRHYIIIPNSQLISGSVKNLSFTGASARIVIMIGVSYDSDVDKVKRLLLEIAHGIENVVEDPEPVVALADFGADSIDFKLMCFVADVTTGAGVASDIKFEIARRFASEGIEIPFPQRTVHIDGIAELLERSRGGGAESPKIVPA